MVKKSRARGRGRTIGPKKKWSNYIKAWRVYRGIKTQGELAKSAGLTRATISRLESGDLPYRQWLLEAIAISLDCTSFDLVGTDPNTMDSIFKIYYQALCKIPAEKRPQALRLLETFIAE